MHTTTSTAAPRPSHTHSPHPHHPPTSTHPRTPPPVDHGRRTCPRSCSCGCPCSSPPDIAHRATQGAVPAEPGAASFLFHHAEVEVVVVVSAPVVARAVVDDVVDLQQSTSLWMLQIVSRARRSSDGTAVPGIGIPALMKLVGGDNRLNQTAC